jgi:hypothetical protein
MKRLLLLLTIAASAFAVPITFTYSNPAWYTGFDPYLVGNRADFMIQSVSVTADTAANSFAATLKFNFGNTTLNPYNLQQSPGVNVAIHAADLFFMQNGVIRYGVPLVTHGGNQNRQVGGGTGSTVNGQTTGAVVDAGDLYKINNANAGIFLSNYLSSQLGSFGENRAVWINDSTNSANNDVVSVRQGTSSATYSGVLCTSNATNNQSGNTGTCAVPEFTVNLAISGGSGADWTAFLAGVANGSIRPYFTGSTCGNDLLIGQVPEPGTMVLMSGAIGLLALRLRRRK